MRHTTMAVVFVCALSLMGSMAWAQSSGNFAAQINDTACAVSTSTGQTSGGIETPISLTTTIKTPNSSSTALLIRPSAVTGLFTSVKLGNTTTSASATGSVTVHVTLDGNPVQPDTGSGVIYDQRVLIVTANFLSGLSTCTSTNDCFEITIGTLSAHSMDFVAGNVGGGTHTLEVDYDLVPGTQTSTEGACVGPAVLTVEQVKTFSTGGGISLQ